MFDNFSCVLSFEAISRGASSVTSLEKVRCNYENIYANKQELSIENLQLLNADALEWLNNNKSSFDIVFVDPPYHLELWREVLSKLIINSIVVSGSRIFLEHNREISLGELGKDLEVIKAKKAGKVYYYLIKVV